MVSFSVSPEKADFFMCTHFPDAFSYGFCSIWSKSEFYKNWNASEIIREQVIQFTHTYLIFVKLLIYLYTYN